jgi:ABC-2 type transport system ATP-binding protein
MSIVLKNVSKIYGRVTAVHDISFALRPGEVTALLGPNGAGKTTTLRLITGFVSPTSGSISISGTPSSRQSAELRRQIGYLPEDNPLYLDMCVVDFLEFSAGLAGVPKEARKSRVGQMLDLFGLQHVMYRNIGKLSRGYRQRVGLAVTLVHDPPVLIYDEPTSSLDPNQVIEFRNFITELGRQRTILFSTHNLAEVQAICSRVIIMNRGRILADGPIATLQQEFQGGLQYFVSVELDAGTTDGMAETALQDLECIKRVVPLEQEWENKQMRSFYVEAQRDTNPMKEVFEMCKEKSWRLVDIQRRKVRIEDIFHELTRQDPS